MYHFNDFQKVGNGGMVLLKFILGKKVYSR